MCLLGIRSVVTDCTHEKGRKFEEVQCLPNPTSLHTWYIVTFTLPKKGVWMLLDDPTGS